MRISVNLASRPFVELRPFFLRLRIIMAVLVVVGVGVAIAAHSMQKKLNIAQAQMDDLRYRTIALQEEKQHNENRMRQPQNSAVLDRSHFLNALFLRKSFSWTAIMMDLENVLPLGVQVTSIEPQVTADGDVVIHMRVSGDRDRAVLLVRNLERSRRFLAPRLNGESAQAAKQANGAPIAPGAPTPVEFEILANYNPIAEGDATIKAPAKKVTGSPLGTGVASGSAPKHHLLPRLPGLKPNPKPGAKDGVVLKPYAARPSGQAKPNPAVPLTPANGGKP